MIKRNDLVKEFEQVTRQEIINHNAAILATNVSIEDLKRKVREIEFKEDARLAYVKSEFSKISIAIDKVSLEFSDLKSSLLSKLNDMKMQIDLFLDTTLQEIKKIKQEYLLKSEHQQFSEWLENELSLVDKEQSLIRDHFNREISFLGMCSHSDIQKLTADIKEIPYLHKDEKDALLKLIDINRVDKEGLLKELQVFKKNQMVYDKHLEYIFTRIDRLKQEIEGRT